MRSLLGGDLADVLGVGVDKALDITFVDVAPVYPVDVLERLAKRNAKSSVQVHAHPLHQELVVDTLLEDSFEHALCLV